MKCVFAAFLLATTALAEKSAPLQVTPPTLAPMPTAPLPSREAADALNAQELEQVLDILRGNYIRPEELDDLAVARAGMQGVLDRLGAGARIYTRQPPATELASPLRAETLVDGFAYVRVGALANLPELDQALDGFSAKPPSGLILDLRATPPSTDFELAAEVCRRFAPKGRILFSIKRPKANDEEILTSRSEPRWRGPLVVLVDGDTAGASEVIAAVLRTHVRAYIVGQRTQGEAAQFEDLPLPGGKFLRIAVGEVTLPDNSPVFPGGLTPDLPVPQTQEQTDEVLRLALKASAASLVVEKERPRMNEAALIAGTNPEFDAAHERQKAKARGDEQKLEVRDVALQRALDYLVAIRVFDPARWTK